MLDIEILRKNPEKIEKALKNRQIKGVKVSHLADLDSAKRKLISQLDDLRQERNKISDQISRERDNGLIEKAKGLKQQIDELEIQFEAIDKEFSEAWSLMPNIPFDFVPVGKSEQDNKVLRQVGQKPEFDFQPKEYLEIAERLDLIDMQRAAKVSGTRFGYIKGRLVQLHFALINFAFEILTAENFIPVLPPVIIKKEMMKAMGYIDTPEDEEERYVLEKDKQVLVGTSEQSIGPMHADEIFEESDLPKRYVAYSSCFRREAGSYGKDTKGILRVHQFEKAEMFIYSKPENSEKEHELILGMQEKLMQALKIPYQAVALCTADIARPSAATFDIESWMPGQGVYRETHSCSNTTDFQSRRLNIKYRKNDGRTELVHMLNGTVFSMRPLIAIIENYQQKDGSVLVPEVLRKYTGFEKIQ